MAGPSYNVGSLRLTVVSDGTAWLDAGAVPFAARNSRKRRR